MQKPTLLAALLLGVIVMTFKIIFLLRKNRAPHEADA
jgi:hypothetical protein